MPKLLLTATIKVFDGADPVLDVDWSGGIPTPEQLSRWGEIAKQLAADLEALKAIKP